MSVISIGIRKAIKITAVAAQTAQFISLMPKPKDFVTRVVGDVVYLSSRVIQLSDEMNKLLDSYAEIPTNYLMTQLNSITGSLTGITDRVNIYAQNAANQVISLGENTVSTITELTGSVIDTTGELTSAVVSLGNAVAETASNALGNTGVAEDIHDATEVVMEWTDEGFKSVNARVTDPMKKATQKIIDYKTGVTNSINKTATAIDDKISQARTWVDSLIMDLSQKMKKLEETLDTGFKDVTGMSSVQKGASVISQELLKLDNSSAAQATSASAEAVASVIKNFSIGKMAVAFMGVVTQSALVKTGLDKLPPIDFESMMCKIRDDLTISSQDLYKQYLELTDTTYNNLMEFSEEAARLKSEERHYSAKNYEEYVKEFDETLKKRRDDIRLMMKNASRKPDRSNFEEAQMKTELQSAIKEIDKYREKIQNAREADTLRTIIGDEISNFKKEVEYRCNSIKADWKSMMDQYKNAIKEIKYFFTDGGSCDMFIDDCCDAINHDFDEIKSLCSNLAVQLANSMITLVAPDSLPGIPNPIKKIPSFVKDMKIILKFIKDLITLILDIINHINKLARIILNGILSLKEIINQLMDLLGLKWLMDLVQSIIDVFSSNIMNARERLENSLSPVQFSDTEEYNNVLEALDEMMEGDSIKMTAEGKAYLSDVANLLEGIIDKKKDKDLVKLVSNINGIKNKPSLNEEGVDDLIDDLEKQGEFIVAYKSPIIKELGPEDSTPVSDLMNGSDLENDIKFIGWHFFHPNLMHTGSTYYNTDLRKRIKSKIIKKAAKTGHKKNGGVNRLKIKNVGSRLKKRDTAYVAFYWYTYYTEDLEKDCFEWTTVDNSIIIDNVVTTENGSVVEVTDINGQTRKVFVANANVRGGDYVNVDGVKYRVKK